MRRPFSLSRLVLSVLIACGVSLSTAQGAFAGQKVIGLLPAASSVDAADLDGDGDRDVVVASLHGDPNPIARIVWFESDGAANPAFTARTVSPDPYPAGRVHAADLDSDGDADIAAIRFTPIRFPIFDQTQLLWFENTGGSPPSFTPRVLSTVPNSTGLGLDISSADVDGDGDLDLLYLARSGIVWLDNDGTAPPSFTPRLVATVDTPTFGSVEAADVDGDGDLDVVSAWDFFDPTFDPFPIIRAHLAWYESDGAAPPLFTSHEIASSSLTRVMAARAADVDGDGDTDIAAAWGEKDTIDWYENDGASAPAFARHVVTEDPDGIGPKKGFVQGPVDVAAGDLDADGDVDLVSASTGDATIASFLNRGGSPPAFRRHILTSKADHPAGVALDDMDGDGDLDVLSASLFDGKVAWYESR